MNSFSNESSRDIICTLILSHFNIYIRVILLPAHPASFTHIFVSGMQNFKGCNGIEDFS